MNRYVYEVLSRRSEFRGCVDVIFSGASVCLSAGHTYHVRLNDDTRAPRFSRASARLRNPEHLRARIILCRDDDHEPSFPG